MFNVDCQGLQGRQVLGGNLCMIVRNWSGRSNDIAKMI